MLVGGQSEPEPEPEPEPCLPTYEGQDLEAAALRVQQLATVVAAPQQIGTASVLREFCVDEFMLWKGAIEAVHRCVLATGERLEGNCLCSLRYNAAGKQRGSGGGFVLERGKRNAVRCNLYLLAQLGLADSVLEVGSNAGHSCALFCFGWDMRGGGTRQSYLGFDLCEHEYAAPCFEALRRIYAPAGSDRKMELVPGDSGATLKGG